MILYKLKKFLASNEHYQHFVIPENPVKFNELFKDQQFDTVQLHVIQIYANTTSIVDFCGAFSWKDNKLVSLDGDAYNENMTVFGYYRWTDEEKNIKSGLDIIVGDDW